MCASVAKRSLFARCLLGSDSEFGICLLASLQTKSCLAQLFVWLLPGASSSMLASTLLKQV